MRLMILYPCALLAVAFGTDRVVGEPPATPQLVAARQPDKIKELQEKRIALLKEIVEVTEKAFKGAQSSYDQVIKARLDLLQAQLDATQKKEDRIRLLEEMVKHAEDLEKAVQKLFEAKQVGQVDALKAQAFVLQTKIALEQAKAAKGE